MKIGPRPWHERWERKELKGMQDLDLPEEYFKRAKELAQPWEKYDMMKRYRERINEDETEEVMRKVHQGLNKISKKKNWVS